MKFDLARQRIYLGSDIYRKRRPIRTDKHKLKKENNPPMDMLSIAYSKSHYGVNLVAPFRLKHKYYLNKLVYGSMLFVSRGGMK